MKTYWNITGGLSQLEAWQPNCWIQVTCPSEEDIQMLEEEYKIPDYFLSDISDTDERARYEYDDGYLPVDYQQHHEHPHAYADVGDHHPDAAHAGGFVLRHEPRQRHGGEVLGLHLRPHHFRTRILRLLVVLPPQAAGVNVKKQ